MKSVLQSVLGKSNKGLIFKSFEPVDLTLLGTRKKIFVFSGVDNRSYYHTVFRVAQESRIVLKNAVEFVELEKRLEKIMGHSYKYKHLLVRAPMCSKSENYLVHNGWKVFYDFV
ncbi:MAG: hypothetical protein PHN38_01190 [Sulfurospirillaceae bacterium]|nr:hypothetical protein [Sulfurospirillaceae bacterium]MDD3462386.1 hypothetical protein [Sulfurospirillaceae bacterium]